jgi:hypothetical protein
MYTGWAESKCGAKVHTDPCNCTFHEKVQCYRRPKKHAKSRITSLDLGNQGLPPSGGIPLALLDLTGLVLLRLPENQLVGTIPATIAKLTGLEELVLGSNNFSGTVPKEMLQLTQLKDLRLDTNSNLTGLLPAFNFSQFTECCAMGGDPFTCPLPPGVLKCVGGDNCQGNYRPPPTCHMHPL